MVNYIFTFRETCTIMLGLCITLTLFCFIKETVLIALILILGIPCTCASNVSSIGVWWHGKLTGSRITMYMTLSWFVYIPSLLYVQKHSDVTEVKGL